MRTGDVAAIPQSLSYHMWKLSIHTETAALVRRPLSSKLYRAVSTRLKPSDQSIPWKAYLASRQIQDVAADLAEAIFSPAGSPVAQPLDLPVCFKTPDLSVPDSACVQMLLRVTLPARDSADVRPPDEAEPAVRLAA